MELAVQAGTVAASSKEAAKRRATERARSRARRDPGPASRQPEWLRMATAFPNAVVTDAERIH